MALCSPGFPWSPLPESTNGAKHTTVTDSKGFYSVPALDVGNYDVSASQTGFRDFLEQGVKIDANSAIRVDIALQVGAVNNVVTVQSNALQVETENTQMGEVIGEQQIATMPLNGRSFIDLLALQPGVSPYQSTGLTKGAGLSETGVSGDLTDGTQSVNGSRTGANGFMVNGGDSQEGVHNGAALIPNLDSIAEFRIITNNFNAEYGNYSGGQINVVTKSGTNSFHGDVFEFLRNTDLDARNYYSPTRGVYIQNQFGGTIGGPIKKNKIFFFGDYQGTRQTIGQTQFFPVPTASDRTGSLVTGPSDGIYRGHPSKRRHRGQRCVLCKSSFPGTRVSRNQRRGILHAGMRQLIPVRISQRYHSAICVVAGRGQYFKIHPRAQLSGWGFLPDSRFSLDLKR